MINHLLRNYQYLHNIFINQTVPGKINCFNGGNMIACTHRARVIPVTVWVMPNNVLNEQLTTNQKLKLGMDYSKQSETIFVPKVRTGK